MDLVDEGTAADEGPPPGHTIGVPYRVAPWSSPQLPDTRKSRELARSGVHTGPGAPPSGVDFKETERLRKAKFAALRARDAGNVNATSEDFLEDIGPPPGNRRVSTTRTHVFAGTAAAISGGTLASGNGLTGAGLLQVTRRCITAV